MFEAFTENLMMISVMVALFYIVVAACVIGDLISGVRKARMRGEERRSKKYRRTITKAREYYSLLLALTFIDVVVMIAAMYLSHFHGWGVPIFPVFTFIGTVSECLVETKSIFENADKKGDITDTAKLAAAIVAAKGSPEEIAEKVAEYLNKNREEIER